jgi:hypothetical protein
MGLFVGFVYGMDTRGAANTPNWWAWRRRRVPRMRNRLGGSLERVSGTVRPSARAVFEVDDQFEFGEFLELAGSRGALRREGLGGAQQGQVLHNRRPTVLGEMPAT